MTMSRRSVYSLTVFTLLAAFLLSAATGDESGNTYDFDVKPGGTIEFDLKSGASVSILGWDKSKAKVSYVQRGKGEYHDVEILQQRGGLLVKSDMEQLEGRARELAFEIRLPHEYDVRFESMGGSLKIIDLEGEFTGTTMGGNLTLKDARGEVDLETMGGNIEVTGSEVDGEMSTMGGNVYVKDVVGGLKAETMGGNMRYENVRGRDGKLRAPGGESGDDMGAETVTISTMGGSIVVDEAPSGARVSTMGGNIDIDNASGFVKASTMGGNVTIRMENGWVDATTMAGEVDVRVAGGFGGGEKGVNLSSMSGDVTLEIPGDQPVDLDVTISYTKNSSQDFKIISDFDLEIERSKDWDYKNGTPRKRIHGTGKVGSGKYPIVVRTINGTIRIKKAD
jgi:DUF4097 and DUF4098 domain-containing protein YvlB